MRKAATVVASKLTTAIYGEQLKLGKVTEVLNGITFAGGVPILRGDEFIGAVGTSGVRAIEDEHTVFLKTIIPSRKATKQYLGEEADDHED